MSSTTRTATPPAGSIGGEDSHRTKGLLRLTMACNERCPFCNVPAEDYEVLSPPMEAIRRELQPFLDDGAKTLTISGGEPTLLRKRLVTLVTEARAGGVQFVEIQTNAVLVTPDYARDLAAAGVTSAFVSFLSHVPALHEALTELEGSFEKCLAGIDAMLDAGIRVTLNPVMATATQGLIGDYIDFIANRLPRVKFVSMSAVQPHGRGKHHLELMPDYGVLRTSVPDARRRAERHGIEVVNPYCGLPLCIGWDDDPTHSVEAWESRRGGWRQTQGIENRGDKSHGPPCRACAVRTRCGGAWHAYWEQRGGAGIAPPVRVVEPWGVGPHVNCSQSVVRAPFGPDAATFEALDARTEPTVWLATPRLANGDAGRLLRSPCTDLGIRSSVEPLMRSRTTLKAVRRLVRAGHALQPQARVRVYVGLEVDDLALGVVTGAVDVLVGLGVDAVRLLSDDARWSRIAIGLGRARRVDIQHIGRAENPDV